MPKNLKDINTKLPKKRYNPSEEMMKNDKYEIMKETIKNQKIAEKKKMDLSWLNDNNANNNNNYNYNMNGNRRNMNNNNQPRTPVLGKYNYLNKYDNNMRLKNNERQNESNNLKNNRNNNYYNNNRINNNNYNNNNYNNNNYNNNVPNKPFANPFSNSNPYYNKK